MTLYPDGEPSSFPMPNKVSGDLIRIASTLDSLHIQLMDESCHVSAEHLILILSVLGEQISGLADSLRGQVITELSLERVLESQIEPNYVVALAKLRISLQGGIYSQKEIDAMPRVGQVSSTEVSK